jgi:hypothetical protein
MAGILVPNYAAQITPTYEAFPPHDLLTESFSISIGKIDSAQSKEWTSYYNYPAIGLMFSYIRPGNDSVFGQEFSIMPYFELNPSTRFLSHFHFKIGLGCSYFTKSYNKNSDSLNAAIGSRFNWSFHSSLYYNIFENRKFMFMAGIGYMHSSNGHTQLPNFGLNSFFLSISSKFFLNSNPYNFKKTEIKPYIKRENYYFLEERNGLGMQEYGPAKGPAGTPKKPVYSFSVAGGIIFGNCFKLLTGFTYRFYQEQYDHILAYKTPGLINNPTLNASNLLYYVGFEMLFGYVSSDIEIGVNLYKPFFKSFYLPYASVTTTTYKLKSLFPTRLGAKLYLFNTNKIPRNNLYIGANIDANYSQADFSEISIGYVRMIK